MQWFRFQLITILILVSLLGCLFAANTRRHNLRYVGNTLSDDIPWPGALFVYAFDYGWPFTYATYSTSTVAAKEFDNFSGVGLLLNIGTGALILAFVLVPFELTLRYIRSHRFSYGRDHPASFQVDGRLLLWGSSVCLLMVLSTLYFMDSESTNPTEQTSTSFAVSDVPLGEPNNLQLSFEAPERLYVHVNETLAIPLVATGLAVDEGHVAYSLVGDPPEGMWIDNLGTLRWVVSREMVHSVLIIVVRAEIGSDSTTATIVLFVEEGD